MFNKNFKRLSLGMMLATALTVSTAPVCVNTSVSASTAQLRLLDVSIDQTSNIAVGTRVTISPEIEGGVGEVAYTYKVILPNGNFETIAAETSSESISYTVSETGIYNFIVEARDEVSLVSDVRECEVVSDKVMIDSVSFDKTSYTKNDKVKITLGVTPASGTAKTKITVTLPSGKKVTVKKLNTKTTASYKVTKKGTYKFTILAKDSKSKVSVTKTIKVK